MRKSVVIFSPEAMKRQLAGVILSRLMTRGRLAHAISKLGTLDTPTLPFYHKGLVFLPILEKQILHYPLRLRKVTARDREIGLDEALVTRKLCGKEGGALFVFGKQHDPRHIAVQSCDGDKRK